MNILQGSVNHKLYLIFAYCLPLSTTCVADKQVNQLNQLIELTRSELKRDDRQRIMSLITIDAHARDIVLMLIRENVTDKVSNSVALIVVLLHCALLWDAVVSLYCTGHTLAEHPEAHKTRNKSNRAFRCLPILARLISNGHPSLSNVSRESRDTRPTPNSLWRRLTFLTLPSSTDSSFSGMALDS